MAMVSDAHQECAIGLLPAVTWVSVCSYISYSSKSLERYAILSRSFRNRIGQDASWHHLCTDFWRVSDVDRGDWPKFSSFRKLYRVLEQWAPLEGFYRLQSAFPWCLLVLVRFSDGAFVADALRFSTQSDGTSKEILVRLFEITFLEVGENTRDVQCHVHMVSEAEDFSGGLVVAGLPQQLGSSLSHAVSFFQNVDEVVPRWLSAARGLVVECVEGPDEDADGVLKATLEEAWGTRPKKLTEATLRSETQLMACSMLKVSGLLSLGMVRSPIEYMLDDASAPQLRPGLYVGNYGHEMYGQFKHEALLLEYRECTYQTFAELFSRPFSDSDVPQELRDLFDGSPSLVEQGATFLVGTKVTGDIHVPAGQTTFVALCRPPDLCDRWVSRAPVRQARNRINGLTERVVRQWRGFGTLAHPGFRDPSWSGGALVQLEPLSAGDRFAFCWDRDQDVIVLEYVQTQLTSPFLSRKWLPEGVR